MTAGFGFSYPAGVTGNESAISGNDTIRDRKSTRLNSSHWE